MESTASAFASRLQDMIEGGRPDWEEFAKIADERSINLEEAITWLDDIVDGKL
jgi:hypothetical protein